MMPDVLAIRRLDDDTAEVAIALPADHPAFAGHFPDRPILPGVVQLDWAVRLAARSFGHAFRPTRRFQIKYTRLLTPLPADSSVSLRLGRVRRGITFTYRVGDTILSSGRIWLDA